MFVLLNNVSCVRLTIYERSSSVLCRVMIIGGSFAKIYEDQHGEEHLNGCWSWLDDWATVQDGTTKATRLSSLLFQRN